MAVRAVQVARAGRHHVHRAPQTAADLLALVPPHHRADVRVVLVLRQLGVYSVVHRNQLLCALDDVHVLRVPGYGLPAALVRAHVHHGQPVVANVHRLFHQLYGVQLHDGGWSTVVSGAPTERHAIVVHVF